MATIGGSVTGIKLQAKEVVHTAARVLFYVT
jgi:hypothetical protein